MHIDSEPGQPANLSDATTSETDSSPTPIAELLEAPDFPRNALGKLVDIGGYVGVVSDVINQSLKVRSPEGVTKSFNANGLRRIYIRMIPPEPPPTLFEAPPTERRMSAPGTSALPQPLPVIEPDFSKPPKEIADLVRVPDYPQGLLGEHVRIGDFSGVVVQIRSEERRVGK